MLRRPALASALLLAAAGAAEARDCRIPEAPPGVRVAPARGCGAARPRPAPPPAAQGVRTGRSPGTVVLENGTEIRIGGRVRLDALGQR